MSKVRKVYAPWINGTVERLNKNLPQVLRVTLLEYRVDITQWPYLLSVIQPCLNHTPAESLGGYAPMEPFLALPKPSSLDSIVVANGGVVQFVKVDLEKVNEWLDTTRHSLHGLHRDVVDRKERKRLQEMGSKRATVCIFDTGDYVLWSRVDEGFPNGKLPSTWLSPFKIAETRELSFMIEHILSKATYDVHGSRLKYCHDPSLGVTEELREFVSEQGIELGVESIEGYRFNKK